MSDMMLKSILKSIKPMLPKAQPPKNPVSEFISGLFTDQFNDAGELELLHTIAVNISNEDPNRVLELLVSAHNSIGAFVTKLTDGEFKEWQPPEVIDGKGVE